MTRKTHIYIDFFILALVVVIAYWQVCLSQFTIKGDAALLSVPWKKFVSDSLRNGYLPVWNPYINLGWMQGMEPSTWYYPSWIFALFGKFRLSFLHIEIGFHYVLGAWGAYKLLLLLKLNRWALLAGSTAYILSGFFVANFQHLGWTYFGCWLPVFLYYLFKTVYSPSLPAALKLGISASMLVLSSYIPLTVTTLMLTCAFVFVFFIRCLATKKTGTARTVFIYLVISITVFILVSSPALYMLFTSLDTMYRSGRYTDETASFGALLPKSLITLFLPFASTADAQYWKGTDISMNNVFFGCISLVFGMWALAHKAHRKVAIITGIVGFIALVFSMGPFIPPTWYVFRHLPFYEKLRFTSQFRIFFILAGCILTAIGTDRLLKQEHSTKRIIAGMFLLSGGFLLIGALNYSPEFFTYTYAILVEAQNTAAILPSAGFQAFVFAGIILVCMVPIVLHRRDPMRFTRWLIVLNILMLMVAVQMNFFYTGVANTRVKKIDAAFLGLPEKFTPIDNRTFNEYRTPGIGYTWTNTEGMFHVPSIHCYHPYDSPNFGEYNHSTPQTQKDAPFIYGHTPYQPEFIAGCREVSLNPYSIAFTNTNKGIDSLFIQATTYSGTRLKINGQYSTLHTVRNQVCITDIPADSRVELIFLPVAIGPVTGIAVVTLLLLGAYLVVYKLRRVKSNPMD